MTHPCAHITKSRRGSYMTVDETIILELGLSDLMPLALQINIL